MIFTVGSCCSSHGTGIAYGLSLIVGALYHLVETEAGKVLGHTLKVAQYELDEVQIVVCHHALHMIVLHILEDQFLVCLARIDEPPGIEGTDAQNAVTHRGGYILRIHLFGCAIHEFDDGIDVSWFSHTLISSNIWFRYSCVRCTACGEPAAARSSSFLRSCCFTVAMPR